MYCHLQSIHSDYFYLDYSAQSMWTNTLPPNKPSHARNDAPVTSPPPAKGICLVGSLIELATNLCKMGSDCMIFQVFSNTCLVSKSVCSINWGKKLSGITENSLKIMPFNLPAYTQA